MLLLIAGPLYAGCYAGLFWLYGKPVQDQALSLDYQVNTYQALIHYWQGHPQLGFTSFTLPAFGPPLLGLLLGIIFFVVFVRWLRATLFMAS